MTTTETVDWSEHIRKQNARGVFAYWDPAVELAWKAQAPDPPKLPRIVGRQRGWQSYVPISARPNSRTPCLDPEDRTFKWKLDMGRSYMVGRDTPMSAYIRSHRSPVTAWQKIAYAWALANPFYKLKITMPGRKWEVYAEGDYVMFALPYHDAGGERHYVSANGRSKVLINVD